MQKKLNKEGCKPSHAICFGFLPVFVPTYCKLAWGRECTVHVQMNQQTEEITHHRKLVRHKTSRRHAWGEGIWNFYVERLFCCFSSKSIFASFPQPRTRQRKKTKLNEEIVWTFQSAASFFVSLVTTRCHVIGFGRTKWRHETSHSLPDPNNEQRWRSVRNKMVRKTCFQRL